jgi:ribosome-associated toxin RatA of RatAB toxin-antitoxin module
MPSYASCRSAVISAEPQECFDALTDYEALPQWQGAVKAARILERDEHGRGKLVEYEVDATVRKVRYVLEQQYAEPERIGSRYVEGDFKDFAGEWRLLPDDGGTLAELEVTIDPGLMVPGPVRRVVSNAVVRRALRDLAAHFD